MDITNMFLVGSMGDKIVIQIPPNRPLSKDEALNLAAWLVALASTNLEEDFEPILITLYGGVNHGHRKACL
jgi:hypothetical protein